MPVYVYHCDSCEKDFEVTHRMSDPALTDCECGGKGTVRRMVSAGAGLIFKGSGFYITDYKNGSSGKEAANSESKSEAKAESGAASSSGSGHGCGSSCGCGSK